MRSSSPPASESTRRRSARRCCRGLECLGLELDAEANARCRAGRRRGATRLAGAHPRDRDPRGSDDARGGGPRDRGMMPAAKRRILVVDVGGSSVKVLATHVREARSAASGPELTPRRMVAVAKRLARDWRYDVVSLGFPGPVFHGGRCASPRTSAPAGSASTSAGVRQAGAHRQRRGDAGARQLRGRSHALPRPRHGPRLGARSSTASSSRWSSRTCRTRTGAASRTTSACGGYGGLVGNAGTTAVRAVVARCGRRCRPTTSSWGAAMRG